MTERAVGDKRHPVLPASLQDAVALRLPVQQAVLYLYKADVSQNAVSICRSEVAIAKADAALVLDAQSDSAPHSQLCRLETEEVTWAW